MAIAEDILRGDPCNLYFENQLRFPSSGPRVAAKRLGSNGSGISSQGCGIISDALIAWCRREESHLRVSDWQSFQRQAADAYPSARDSANSENPSPPETEQAPPATSQPTMMETGVASWYGPKFHGKLTASGEVFNQEKFTAAHQTLPGVSRVKVTNLANGKSVDVRINDRRTLWKRAHHRCLSGCGKSPRHVGRGSLTSGWNGFLILRDQTNWLQDK